MELLKIVGVVVYTIAVFGAGLLVGRKNPAVATAAANVAVKAEADAKKI